MPDDFNFTVVEDTEQSGLIGGAGFTVLDGKTNNRISYWMWDRKTAHLAAKYLNTAKMVPQDFTWEPNI